MVAGAPANGGSCVARHEGRVVFVRYALPGETVRARVTVDRGSYWHAEVVEVIEPSRTGSSRCARSPASTAPAAVTWRSRGRRRPGPSRAQVVGNQLQRLGGHHWGGADAVAEPLAESVTPGGAPGSGWTSAPTVAPVFTATTATSW